MFSFIIMLQPVLLTNNVIDYWSDDFDVSQDCKYTDEIKKIPKHQCVSTAADKDNERVISLCKTKLSNALKKECAISRVENPGKLMYCTSRGISNCCFSNHTCASGDQFQNAIYDKAKEYLQAKDVMLNHFVKSLGYKTCHLLDSLDASKCAKDCKKIEKSDFAKKCKSDGGFFKCCIRRDKRSCNECRFCCTLPMCTKHPGGREATTFDIDATIDHKQENYTFNAVDIFFSEDYIYKKDDYQCLKPDDSTDPKVWRRYDVNDFRKAYDEETLAKATTYRYNNHLHNFVDPKVMNAFTKSEKKGRKLWKKAYGLQYTKRMEGFHHSGNLSIKRQNLFPCLKQCLKVEQSTYGKFCKKKNGFLKCCVKPFRIAEFEEARNTLIKAGLIKGDVSKDCNDKAKKDPCMYCSLEVLCTIRNPLSGKL